MLYRIREKIIQGGSVTRDEALNLSRLKGPAVLELISVSSSITRHHSKDRLELCTIINAKSGNCSEDCTFCAQSCRHHTGLEVYPMVSPDETLAQAMAFNRSNSFFQYH